MPGAVEVTQSPQGPLPTGTRVAAALSRSAPTFHTLASPSWLAVAYLCFT